MQNEYVTTMTEEQAREAILEYQKRTKKSGNTIGRELGHQNGSAYSSFLAGTYATPHKMIERIEQLLKISVKRDVAPKKPGFAMTTASRQVTALITLCHVQGELGVAYGDPGVGKTMAIRQYAKENPDAIVITVSPTFNSIAAVNELIAEKLKIKGKNNRRITAEIIAKLKGSKRIIIVDEAQHLKARVVNHLRSIVDATEDEETGERIGMALIGNDEIYHELRVRQAAAFGQVADRVVSWAHVAAANTKLEDLKLIFSEADFDRDALELLHRISKKISVRKAVHVYTNALIVHQIKDYGDITATKLASTAKEMSVKVGE